MFLETDGLLPAQEDRAVGKERGAQVLGVGRAERLGEVKPGNLRADGGLAAVGGEAAGQGIGALGCHLSRPFRACS